MNCNATDHISGPMSDGSHSFVMTYKFQRPKAECTIPSLQILRFKSYETHLM